MLLFVKEPEMELCARTLQVVLDSCWEEMAAQLSIFQSLCGPPEEPQDSRRGKGSTSKWLEDPKMKFIS